jgi:putative acetyltransferase
MDIKVGELRHEAVISLLQEHHEDMLSHSPPESVHALDLSALEHPDVTFWSLWVNQDLAGIGAIKELDKDHCEIKSMRTSARFLRKGIARKILGHIVEQATIRSYKRLSLETGTIKHVSLLVTTKKIHIVCLCQRQLSKVYLTRN